MSTLRDVNETFSMISEAARHVSSKADAEYAARTVELWLDQVNREIEELEEEDE